jgi:hypothetical protein
MDGAITIVEYLKLVQNSELGGVAFWAFPLDTADFVTETSEGLTLFPEVVELGFLNKPPLYLTWDPVEIDVQVIVTTQLHLRRNTYCLDRISMRAKKSEPRLIGSRLKSAYAYTTDQVSERRIVAIRHVFSSASGHEMSLWVATGCALESGLASEFIVSPSAPESKLALVPIVTLDDSGISILHT